MAMQQSSKGASGSGPNPALSDEQAEQFAASFTPAWDVDDGLGDTTNATADATITNTAVIESVPPAAATAPLVVGSPPVVLSSKQTMIGVPAPAHLANVAAPVRPAVESAEAIDPENVLEVQTAPPVQAAPAAPPVHVNHGMRTQVMEQRPTAQPPHAAPQAAPQPAPARNGVRSNPPPARVAIASDPFRSRNASSVDDTDFVPKRSSKTIIFVIAGLAVAAGLGLFLKFALSDDGPTAPPTQVVTGPAVTTAEIPPPPPRVDTPPPPSTTAAATAAKTAEPAPPPLAVPPRAAVEPPAPRAAAAPPRSEPRQPRGAALPPPQAAAVAPPTPPASPKTPPKPPNGGIVRDNPF